jgi:CO dehydrogenase/acetyl-CoA synthase epsilon subunit
MAQNLFDFISLFYLDADSDGIDGGLNQDLLVLIAAYDNWLQQYLFRITEKR